MVVGAVLPAGRPDQLERVGKAQQLGPGAVGDRVRNAVDQVIAEPRLLKRLVEAEEADDAVDVDGEHGSIRLHARRVPTAPC